MMKVGKIPLYWALEMCAQAYYWYPLPITVLSTHALIILFLSTTKKRKETKKLIIVLKDNQVIAIIMLIERKKNCYHVSM